ncbi:MAG: D-glyceraldehyde dehydrogenase [Candidatus Thermoplasmatota archaeon]|nr:D-glyceraldehyde dehydrogenase [Candidatus Thermoplasmatota archaeon]
MKNYIDGEWTGSSTGEVLEKKNPSTGESVGNFPSASREDVNRAIDAAETAFERWNSLGSRERSRIIVRTADLVREKRNELENILILENGKVPVQAGEEVDGVLDQLLYYAGFERKITGEVVEGDSPKRMILQYRTPYGVVAALTPWNFPAAMVARKLAPALLTGNTVVLKPSSDTPMSAEWIVRKFLEAGVPRGVVNFVTGKGSEIGDHLVSHRKVSLVTMTGSTGTGQRIMTKTAANMAKLVLELGGKAPFIVWDDADIVNSLKSLIWAKFWNGGQSCIAAERLYVQEKVYDRFVEKFVSATEKMRVGDPNTSDMGPLINRGAVEATEKFVNAASGSGMKILTGGKKPELKGKFSKGYFYLPTIIDHADQESPIFQEEIFGPVIGVQIVSTLDEALERANDSRYGLASYIFSKDNRVVFEAAEKLRFGEIYVNMPGPESSQGYHTGFRLTGQAGEGSKYGIEEYVKLKNVYLDYSGKPLHIGSVREDLF